MHTVSGFTCFLVDVRCVRTFTGVTVQYAHECEIVEVV
jgi:hypothetical protein